MYVATEHKTGLTRKSLRNTVRDTNIYYMACISSPAQTKKNDYVVFVFVFVFRSTSLYVSTISIWFASILYQVKPGTQIPL